MRVNFNKNKILLMAIILIIFILGWNTLFMNKGVNRENKKSLISIMEELQVGDSQNKIESIFHKHKTETLNLLKLNDYWQVDTPIEFGASNWVLLIYFDSDGKIEALRVRLADSIDMKPKGSPLDKER